MQLSGYAMDADDRVTRIEGADAEIFADDLIFSRATSGAAASTLIRR
jgi:hypothetical protein